EHPVGHASASTSIRFEGDRRNVDLILDSLGSVSGRVVNYDGLTPVAGASVVFDGSKVHIPATTTAFDGSFRVAAVAAEQTFRLTADVVVNGIVRKGFIDGATPQGGGEVSNLTIVLREQSSVEGTIVDAANHAVAGAKYWLRELAWPYRESGTPTSPYIADQNGHFAIANVFTGAYRLTAVSPANQDVRGDFQGTLAGEGDISQQNLRVTIGGAGTGSVVVTVTETQSGSSAPVPNAEVALLRRGSGFDFTTTNANGIAVFSDVPVDAGYSISAFAKLLGRTGASQQSFAVLANQSTSVNVPLEFRGRVQGTVLDEESLPLANQPVAGCIVTLRSNSFVTRASTDEHGAFLFDGIPAGLFELSGFDVDSGRGTKPAIGEVSKANQIATVPLTLERTAKLTVNAYLPDDRGLAGQLAPLVDVTVRQTNYLREQQGNALDFGRMFAGLPFSIEVKEIGGQGRVVRTTGSFAANTFAQTVSVIFPTDGSIEVKVVDGDGAPVADAQVQLDGNGRSATLFTGPTGIVAIGGWPFGYVAASAQKGIVGASEGKILESHSVPLTFELRLGTSATVSGFIDGEDGLPSSGTRVHARITSTLLRSADLQLDTRTDANGFFSFRNVPVGNTNITFTGYLPDDETVGIVKSVAVADGSHGTVDAGRFRLDGTPPRIVAIDPPNNANNVSPNAEIRVTFSEAIADAFRTTQYFQLTSTDDGAVVPTTATAELGPQGTYIIRVAAPAPPAGQFRLKSRTTYRFVVAAGITDTGGHPMKSSLGTVFTTVDYTKPSI
ncbi:MAG TPA: Ig-like domain-containing protein, partial [Thermoanaerobaculia bacterium]|nr:Ig-like domain-containing protein [Thermoanaerobaculia bacterium]